MEKMDVIVAKAKYHNELIASLFLEINKDKAVGVFKIYYNKQLRLSPEDSTSLRSWVSLNDTQYSRLMQGLFVSRTYECYLQ